MRAPPSAPSRARRPPRKVGQSLAAIGSALIALSPLAAFATDFEVQADTALQFYEVSNPWGNVTLERRRFLQTVGLAAYNLQGRYKPGEGDYRVVTMMRLNADFGVNGHLPDRQAGGETSYLTQGGSGVRFIPGYDEAPLDLMFAYVEGRNLAHGLLGFKLGRQYVTDVLGWWAFDGALVRVTTPYFIQAEIYGGLEERGGLPLSSSRFERQGVWRGSHGGFGTGADLPSVVDYPSYLYTEPAPALGFALESAGPTWLHGRFSYRRTWNTGTVLTQQFPDPSGGYRSLTGTRLSQERLGYAIDANKRDLGGLKAGFTYDLYSQIVGTYYAGAEAYLGKRATVGADLDYFVPTFDADSIWNWFTRSPVTTATARASVRWSKRFDTSLSGGVRLWLTDGDPNTFGDGECKAIGLAPGCAQTSYANASVGDLKTFVRDEKNRAFATTADGLANLNARYRFGTGNVSLRAMMQAGARGSREGADLAADKGFLGGRYTAGARASVYGWHDPTRPDRDATSFGYVLSGGFKPARVAQFKLEWEHDMNRLIGQRFRVLALINLLVLK
ncbi:MAG: hypothetical protein ABI193_25940 [Minicystis sp.]